MGNQISFGNSTYISMSNQGTDCFLELLEKAASGLVMTARQGMLINFLAERRKINDVAPGTISFDISEMPWNKDTLKEDTAFLLDVIKKAGTPEVFGQLEYRPDARIVKPWLNQFAQMIWRLDRDYIYGTEEEEIVKSGIGAICSVLRGEDTKAKLRLLFYLDWYLDPYYKNDTGNLCDPLKKMLQEVVIPNSPEDVAEEAQHLLDAYLDPP